MSNSGNVLAELAKYGQGMGSQLYQQQLQNYQNLANAYGQQQGQAGQFLTQANANPYERSSLNPSVQGQGWAPSPEYAGTSGIPTTSSWSNY